MPTGPRDSLFPFALPIIGKFARPSIGKTPDGSEARAHVRRLIRRIRLHWPKTVITIRGDSHGACHRA